MSTKPSGGDILLWGLVSAGIWIIGGIVCAIVFYENINRIPTTQPTPEHIQLLAKVLTPWAIVGFTVGLFGLFRFIHLADILGPIRAYPVHVVQMSVISLVLGALMGLLLYPMFDPPPGAILRSVFLRLPLSGIMALVATNMALRIIGGFGKSMR
jgi:hypothetical protein